MHEDSLKGALFIFTILILLIVFGATVNSSDVGVLQLNNTDLSTSKDRDIINITVQEAWELLSDTSNGIQTPIDVRMFSEWKDEHIDTPYPENPQHHCLDDLKNETKLIEFMEIYDGKELIIYCRSGGRSLTASNILNENQFSGVIYNMLGGITAWMASDLPIIVNQPPDLKIINPKEGYIHFSGFPLIPTPFNLIADTLSLGGFRLNPVIINATDDYDNSEDLIVNVYLNDELRAEAEYCCDWRLHEWFWTGLALGDYMLKITAEDIDGNCNNVEMSVWNFCFIP